jgi:hypothetical protein
MTAKEAKDFGFIDVVGNEMKIAACADFDLTAFRNVPAALRVDTAGGAETADMKLLTASLAALLATASGVAITETSTEAEIKAAIDGLTGKVTALETEKKTLDARLVSKPIAALLVIATGVATITEASTEPEIKAALDGVATKITNLTNEVADLKKNQKTADEKGRELAAQHGSDATPKGTTVVTDAAKDGKALFDQYEALMKAGRGSEAAAFATKHEKELDAYAALVARERQARD